MATESIRTQLQSYRERVDEVDDTLTTEMDRWGIPTLRVAIAVVFVWFGALKVFGISPAGELVACFRRSSSRRSPTASRSKASTSSRTSSSSARRW